MTKISGAEGYYGDLSGLHNPELEQLLEERKELKELEPRDYSAIPWVIGAVTLGAVTGKFGWSFGKRWQVRHA